jgi:sulfite reductase alpha subunit-like flavoprotein
MANQEIEKIIEMIDKKIRSLNQAKQILIAEFGLGKAETIPGISMLKTHVVVKNPTRKDIVSNLIKEQGPLSRKEILEKTGLPKGTIAFVLNDKKRFYSKDVKWHLVEEKEPES